MVKNMVKILIIPVVGISVLLSSGCASMMGPQLTAPSDILVPTPIEGNSGEYMCPFTSDDTVTEWVKKGMAASAGAGIGGAVGSLAGQQALQQVPFVGGFLGQKVGSAAGRAIAIKAAGGMESIKELSDLSFNSIDDLSVYIYAKHSTHPDFQQVFKLTTKIYPELQTRYYVAIRNAPKKPVEEIAETVSASVEPVSEEVGRRVVVNQALVAEPAPAVEVEPVVEVAPVVEATPVVEAAAVEVVVEEVAPQAGE